jgi:hypothetical protein
MVPSPSTPPTSGGTPPALSATAKQWIIAAIILAVAIVVAYHYR